MISIVIPTYCEANNIAVLIERIDDVLTTSGHVYQILVVDDNSPDAIVEVIRTVAGSYPVELMQPEGREKDLSLSVIEGVLAARFDQVLVMDADLSHPPERIPRMIEALTENPNAFILGSRYVARGNFDRQWSIWRFLNSHIATLLARLLVNCKDPMSGFFAFNRRLIEDYAKLKPIGYKIGLEFMVRGSFSEIVEVPISFKDREIGESKMSFGQQVKFLRHLRRLYLMKFGSFAVIVNYCFVGLSGIFVDLLIYFLLQVAGVPHYVARAVSFWPAALWNQRLNRTATFGEREMKLSFSYWQAFLWVSLAGFTINWGVYVVLTGHFDFFSRNKMLAFFAGVAAASLLNFVLSSVYVYKSQRR